jgi:hypothetical protein
MSISQSMYYPILRVVFSIVLLLCIGNPCMADEPTPTQPAPAQATPAESSPNGEVFDALDLTRPELADVKAAWDRKDLAGATHAFATYLRNRTNVHWNPDATKPLVPPFFVSEIHAADDAMQGKIQVSGFPFAYTFPDGKINWHYNATAHMPGQAFNGEWSTVLNRTEFWGYLDYAYRATGSRSVLSRITMWADRTPPGAPLMQVFA